MAKNFHLEIREAFDDEYLKVFVKNLDRIDEIRIILEALPSVQKANITESNSKASPPKNLTLYPTYVYSAREMKDEVRAELDSYFGGGSHDPVFIEESIPALGDKAYKKIIDFIIRLGSNYEKYPESAQELSEERLRDNFLFFLNSVSKNHSATGETFNKKGRTDILIQDNEGNGVFIAECKIWRGASKLKDAVTQLLSRYVRWRDEKVAVIVFNKDVSSFSDIIGRAKKAILEHPNCLKYLGKTKSTSLSFLFRNPDDYNKTINLELILFDYS